MLMTTVAIVSVIHAGMNISWAFLEKSEGPQVRAANPTMMTVMRMRRREEDFLPPAACDVS